MEENKIRKYAELMHELNLTGLEISENGSSLRLEQNVSEKETSVNYEETKCERKEADDGLIPLRSPMVGVFYSSPSENKAPFVKVGDTVHKGDVLCIIEAMKLMNEIVAEHDGTIAEICADNKQVVDFGHVLFKLRRD